MTNKDIGKLSAITELQENNISEMKDNEVRIGTEINRLQQTAGELDGLRDIIGVVETIVKDSRRPDWLTTNQLADELHVTPKTIRAWHENGIIPGHRVYEGGHLRFDRMEVARAIKGEKNDNRKKSL